VAAGGLGGGAEQAPKASDADGVPANADGDVGDAGGARTGVAAAGPAAGRPRPPRRGAAVKLLVRIDYDTWLRGVPTDGETCELVGFGPVAVSAVRDLVELGDPFVAAILTRGKHLVGVAHLGRRPNAYQQSALEWLYPSCAVQDCPAKAHLEADHREDWARTRFTVLDLLDLLCRKHHGLKTRANWSLVPGTGKRAFVPPDDPRHPRYRQPSGRARSPDGHSAEPAA
jgi:hypothetical protein